MRVEGKEEKKKKNIYGKEKFPLSINNYKGQQNKYEIPTNLCPTLQSQLLLPLEPETPQLADLGER